MTQELQFTLSALVLGVMITFVYDLLRITRRVIPHNIFWISVEDLGFWIFCGAEVFLLMYHLSNGRLRWFAILGAVSGMLLYNKTISQFFVKYVSLFLNKIVLFFWKIMESLFRPVVKAVGFTASKASAGRKRFCFSVKNRLTRSGKMLRMIISKK